jgi:hypothetical protein
MNLKASLIVFLILISVIPIPVLAQCGNDVCEDRFGENPDNCCQDCICDIGTCKIVKKAWVVLVYNSKFEEAFFEDKKPKIYGDVELELISIGKGTGGIRAVFAGRRDGDEQYEEVVFINIGSITPVKGILVEFQDYQIGGFCEVAAVCGNGKCESGETQDGCCSDCGCLVGKVCKNNQCVIEEIKPIPEPSPEPEPEQEPEPSLEAPIEDDSCPDGGCEKPGFIESFLNLFKNLLTGIFGS